MNARWRVERSRTDLIGILAPGEHVPIVITVTSALELADAIRSACGVPVVPRTTTALCGVSWTSARALGAPEGCAHSCTRARGHDEAPADDPTRLGKMIHICLCSQTFAGARESGVLSSDTTAERRESGQ